jgi:cell division control protein 24
VNTVTYIVDHLPPNVFDEIVPPSPPSTLSSHDSFASTGPVTPAIPTPVNGPDAERNNIIRELVETERKYVQDLEVMQVRSDHRPMLVDPYFLLLFVFVEICSRVVTK